MGSVATQGEGAQNLLCAYMAGALLVGLAGNALFGLWWLDPAAALVIAALAVREGLEAWNGESCCIPTAPGDGDGDACREDCCAPAIAECRLDVPALRAQSDRYRRLGASATHIDRRDALLVVAFGAELDEPLLREAIAVERECCAFFAFDYRPADQRLAITVAQPDQAPALDALHYALNGTDAERPRLTGPGGRAGTRRA